MDIRQAFIMAFKSLLARRVRSLMTMLGIIIGVAAVIVITTVGRGNLAQVEAQFDNIGANMITVSVYGRSAVRQITLEDMYELVSNNRELLCDLSPMTSVGGGIKYGSESYGATAVRGVSEAYPRTDLLELAEGRFFNYMEVERHARVCVAGSFVAREIIGGDALGQNLRLLGQNYRIIGVLAPTDTMEVGAGGPDDIIYIPYTNGLRLGAAVNSYNLNSASRECSEEAVALLESRLGEFYDEDDYRVASQQARLEMLVAMENSMLSALSAIAAIALLVGGVGIMNIMSVSVAERTKEIGVRKSFGARRRDIRLQFLIEAGSTSVIGGLLGVAAGIIISLVVCLIMEIPFTLAVDSLLGALGISAGLGIVFGFLPADRAARMEPVDALRYD